MVLNKDKLISIDLVICTYNNAGLLDRVLNKIANQQVPDNVKWQVLVVNNNCTDETPAVVEKYIQSQSIPQISMLLEPKQGLNHARLCGIQNTTGDWIALVDDDCMLDPDWVAEAAKFASLYPDCGAFGGKVILDWETSPPGYVLKYGYSFAQQEHGMNIMQPNCLVGAGLIISRKAILHTNWIKEQFLSDRVGKKLVSGGDVEMVLRIRSAGYDIWYNPACKLLHYIPTRRTEHKYLVNINYGLGISQLMGDSLTWNNSYQRLIIESIYSTFTATVDICKEALKVRLKRSYMEAAEIPIVLGFVLGKWTGIFRIICMNKQERQKLIGSAKLVNSNT
ncbi:glycosyltransferase [Nostoc sp. UHCC 0870]|uniref:glycosyltransferase n=1 Tax=Nostoc sp. UHCC 0870 TaxID=2914041 RepID=UPI001EE03A78|nr:glycosyltransferase [Nostoc sp. UHCC 0870]UKO97244.1 glycosyltransferase family 2 protein [Nostoc sp. UHCC 0870]